MQANLLPDDYFSGEFVTSSTTLKQKLRQVKAVVFDWDGVFNNGQKNIDGHSSFSEIDSMGINMMRFSHFLQNKQLPISVIISGENNQLAASFAKRESFHANYYKVANKEKALMHLCQQYRISPAEVLFVFDDILDLSVAKIAGVRFMVGRSASPMLTQYAKESRLVDYITQNDGGHNALREISEIVMALSNNFVLAVEHRMKNSEVYQAYINLRNATAPQLFTLQDNEIIQA